MAREGGGSQEMDRQKSRVEERQLLRAFSGLGLSVSCGKVEGRGVGMWLE